MAIELINRDLLQGTSVSEVHNLEFLDKIDEAIAAVNVLEGSAPAGVLLAMQVFDADGTYTPTPGTKRAVVQVTGGGGAGGGAVSNAVTSAGNGGGGGGTRIASFDVDDDAVTGPVVVGAGGAGASGVDGLDGEDSTLIYDGTTYKGSKGFGGDAEAALATPFFGDPAVGGFGTGGVGYEIRGRNGEVCIYLGDPVVKGGDGGSSYIGPGGKGEELNATGIAFGGGAAFNKSGGGGGGGAQNDTSAETGGAGASGLVVIWDYA